MPMPLAKALADSTDKRVRNQAIKALKAFLSAPSSQPQNLTWEQDAELEDARFSPLESLKLSKALFFCFYLCDKPIPQQNLADTLANLLLDANAGNDVANFRAACILYDSFWTVLIKDWATIDRLRMDKYLLLIRRYVAAGLRLLARVNWHPKAIEEYNAILLKGPLQSHGKVPLSISSHLAEIYSSCLETAVEQQSSDTPIPILALLNPFFTFLCLAPKTHCNPVLQHLVTPLLDAFEDEQDSRPAKRRKTSEAAEETQGIRALAFADTEGAPLPGAKVREVLLKSLFDRASEEATVQGNRQRLYRFYELHKGENLD